MSCHTPWRLTRTRTAFRRGGWYTGIPGTRARTPLVVIDGMSDTTAPPLRLRWLRPRHIPRRAGLLWHVSECLSVRLPLLAGRPLWARRVGEHEPVGFGQAAVALRAKRSPRLGLAFLLDLFTCAPCDLHVRHYSITSGSGNLSESGASGPWNRNNVTSSCP